MHVENVIEHKARVFIDDLKVLLEQSAIEFAGEAIRTKLHREFRAGSWSSFAHEMGQLARGATLSLVESQRSRSSLGAPLPAGGRRKRERRTEASIVQVTDYVFGVVRDNPGMRMEELARLTGIPSRKLVVPIKRLLQSERIEVHGNTRATEYFAKEPTARAS